MKVINKTEMSSCVETFSLTQLKERKIFLINQLNIVNDLIENYEKSDNLDIHKNDEMTNIKENKKVTIKIKLKPKDKN